MLGGMEEDPEVRDPLLAKLLGLEFGLPSNEDTLSCKLHQLFLLFSGFNNLVSFPCLGLEFCAVGDGVGVRGIRLSEKIWSFVVLWTVFLILLVCFFAASVDVFVQVVKMYAVRECDRDGERHTF